MSHRVSLTSASGNTAGDSASQPPTPQQSPLSAADGDREREGTPSPQPPTSITAALGQHKSNPVQARYEAILKDLAGREVFDGGINSIRARSLAIAAAVQQAEVVGSKKGKGNSSGGSDPTSALGGTAEATTKKSTENASQRSPLRQSSHFARRLHNARRRGGSGGDAMGDDEAALRGIRQTMRTPYFGAERRFIDDLTKAVDDGRAHALARSGGGGGPQNVQSNATNSNINNNANGFGNVSTTGTKPYIAFSGSAPPADNNNNNNNNNTNSPLPAMAETPEPTMLSIGRTALLATSSSAVEGGGGAVAGRRAQTTQGFYAAAAAASSVGQQRRGQSQPGGGIGGSDESLLDVSAPQLIGGASASLVPEAPAPASAVLQKAIEHIRYPEAESRLRARLKKQYDAAHRSGGDAVGRYLSTVNFNPSATVGLGVLTGATRNGPVGGAGRSGGNLSLSPNATSPQRAPANALPRRPAAAPIADGTANRSIVTAVVDFNAVREAAVMAAHNIADDANARDGSEGKETGGANDAGGEKTAEGGSEKSKERGQQKGGEERGGGGGGDNNMAHGKRAAEAIFSGLDPAALVKGAETTHRHRELLRTRTDAALAKAEEAVLIDTLRTAKTFRPGARGGAAATLTDDDEDDDDFDGDGGNSPFLNSGGGGGGGKKKPMTWKEAALSRQHKAELQEAMGRSNALRAVFARESDSDDDRNDDDALRNDMELPRTGAMRREARQRAIAAAEEAAAARRAKAAGLSVGEMALINSTASGSAANGGSNVNNSSSTSNHQQSTQDTVEDLCDLLECCVVAFCEYMHRSTPLAGLGVGRGGGSNALFGGGGGGGNSNGGGGGIGFEGPPRDIAILRSILIHALSASLPQLQQALRVLEAVQLGTAGVHTLVLEDPLSTAAVASSGAFGGLDLATSAATIASAGGNNNYDASLFVEPSTSAASVARMSAALKAALRERQQELRFRLFRSWTKAFEILLSLDLRHEKGSAAAVASVQQSMLGGASRGPNPNSVVGGGASVQQHMAMGGFGGLPPPRALALKGGGDSGLSASQQQQHLRAVEALGGDTSVATNVLHNAVPEVFSAHSEAHMRRAAAYYCSLHRANADRREFLLALWRENKKAYESALLQGRATNAFHQTVRPEWEEPAPPPPQGNSNSNANTIGSNGAEGGGEATKNGRSRDGSIASTAPSRSAAEEHLAAFSYAPYPLNDALNAPPPSPRRLRAAREHQRQLDSLVDYFTSTRRQLAAEDLSLLDFNSANIMHKQKQLATAFLERLLPKIIATQEYQTSAAGAAGALRRGNGGPNPSNTSNAAPPSQPLVGRFVNDAQSRTAPDAHVAPGDKFRRVLLRYANLAGHGSNKEEAYADYIDEHDATRVDRLIAGRRGEGGNGDGDHTDGFPAGAFPADQSIGPFATHIVSVGGGNQHQQQRSLEAHMGHSPAATAKLMSVFRSSWGRTALSPSVAESEAIVRASVLEDALLLNVMDAYFRLLSEGLQGTFLRLVREEKQRHALLESTAAAATNHSTNASSSSSSPMAGAVALLMNPPTLAANKAAGAAGDEKGRREAEEALRHITRLHLTDKYNAMDAAKERQFADRARERKMAAERLRNRHNLPNSNNSAAENGDGELPRLRDEPGGSGEPSRAPSRNGANATMAASSPQRAPLAMSALSSDGGGGGPMSPERLADVKRLLQSTDAWFGYERGRREAHRSLLTSAGFGDLVGSGTHASAARRIQQQQNSPASSALAALAEAADAEAAAAANKAGGNGTREGGAEGETVAPNATAVAAINKSRAEVLRLSKFHGLQACWAALSVHYALKMSLHDKWNAKDKDAKALDKALSLYKEGAIAVLCREAVLEAIVANETRLRSIVGGGGGGGGSGGKPPTGAAAAIGGAFLNRAFAPSPNRSNAGGPRAPPLRGGGGANNTSTANNNATASPSFFEEMTASSEALGKLAKLETDAANGGGNGGARSSTNALLDATGASGAVSLDQTTLSSAPPHQRPPLSSQLPSNPVVEALREIAALPSTGNKRRDCELARHRLFSELTQCSQRCDVAARRLLNEAGDELLFKNGPYLIKMKEDYETVRALVRAEGMRRV